MVQAGRRLHQIEACSRAPLQRRREAGVLGRPRRGPAGCRIRLSAAVPVLRHRHRRNADRAGGARRHRGAVRRFDPRTHLYRHAWNGGRLRGDVDRRGRLQLGEGASRSLAGRSGCNARGRPPALPVNHSRRVSLASGRCTRSRIDLMELDPVLIARLQFAFTIIWHIIFPAFTIGLSAYIATLCVMWMRSGNERYRELARFWTKIFAVSFAMGVVSGIVLSYEFGTNWSRFSVSLGNVIGPMIGNEVLVAFFLEATFLGVMLFGWNRVPPWL